MVSVTINNFSHIHGWLPIFKPKGPSSFDVIRVLRKYCPQVKCGHAGTLDPLASGLLPIAVGEATKVISWLMAQRKVYRFEVTWGEQRTTDDHAGEVLATSCKRPTLNEIQAVLPQFQGTILQTPPLYSALKIHGKRACDRLRNGEEVTLKSRLIHIESLKVLACPDENRTTFEVKCGKGTYVRSLARDIAQVLGTVGYASVIHRSQIGPFQEENALSLENLAIEAQKGVLQQYIQPLETVLDDIPAVRGDAVVARALRQGRPVPLDRVEIYRGIPEESQVVFIATHNTEPVAIAQLNNAYIWPKRVFNIFNSC
jgi:tRNA pseudouridine55 synthase